METIDMINGKIIESDTSLEIIATPSQNPYFLLRNFCMILFFLFFEVIMIRFMTIDISGIFLLIFIIPVTITLIFLSYKFIWKLLGKEIITITDDKLKIEKQLVGTISQKEYQMSKVKRFQKAEKIFSSKNFKIKVNRRPIQSEYHTNDHYQITFIYDRRRVKFARYMEEFEVGLIENKVKEKFNL